LLKKNWEYFYAATCTCIIIMLMALVYKRIMSSISVATVLTGATQCYFRTQC